MKTKTDVTDYLAHHIRQCDKTHREIAAEAGFDSYNIISMMKSGHTKVPMLRIPALAVALDVEPQELLDLCLQAYYPELHEVISTVMKPACG